MATQAENKKRGQAWAAQARLDTQLTKGPASTYLSVAWTISRALDTYGYDVCTLTDQRTGKKYRAAGGGYDILGTVLGEYLEDVHQDALSALAVKLGTDPDRGAANNYVAGNYGLFVRANGSVYTDGACGQSSMERIAAAIGLTVKETLDKKCHTSGWFIDAA